MNEDVKKLCMLLAAAGFDRYRVDDLLNDISRISSRRLLSEFEKYHKELKRDTDYPSMVVDKKSNYDPYAAPDTTSKVVDLLVNESRLTVKQAFDMLDGILKETFPNRKFPAPNPKIGIAAWVRSLNKEFSDSELLHVASRLRNQIVHGLGEQDDWTLKE